MDMYPKKGKQEDLLTFEASSTETRDNGINSRKRR